MISTEVERLNVLLASFDECRIQSFDGNRLIIIGCWDLSYHHNFEAEFEGVSYLQCPTYFFAHKFRLAQPQEIAQFDHSSTFDDEDFIFCFEADDDQFFIVARALRLREGLVLHYKRED